MRLDQGLGVEERVKEKNKKERVLIFQVTALVHAEMLKKKILY